MTGSNQGSSAGADAPAPPDRPIGASAPDAAPADPPPADGDSTETPPLREMKLVVTLRPGDRAVLALGADGCDPLLLAADVADLRAALDEVPALLAEWVAHPRDRQRGRRRAARA